MIAVKIEQIIYRLYVSLGEKMKVQNIVRILIFLAILGLITFPVAHLNAESTEKNTESTESTKKKSDSAKDSKDVEVDEETEEKLKEVLNKVNEAVKGIEELNKDGILDKRKIDVDALLKKLKVHSNRLKDVEGVKVEISEPTVILESFDESEKLKELKEKIQKLAEDGNLKSNEMKAKIKELVESLKLDSSVLLDKDNVKVYQYGPYVTTKVLKGTDGIKELEEKIKELASDENLDSDELVKKVQDLVKDIKIEKSTVLDKDNVKVYQYSRPYVPTKTFKDAEDYKELGEKISKLAKNEDLDSGELAKKVLKLIKDATPHISTGIIRGNVKVVPLEPSKSLKETNNSNIEKLEKRIEKLETKIDQLIEKLGGSESSDIK